MVTLDLVLNGSWYSKFEAGDITIDYRAMTPYWKTRIWDKRNDITKVRLRKGYTKQFIMRDVDKITIGTINNTPYYLIHTKEIE